MKNPPAGAAAAGASGAAGSVPASGRSPGGQNGDPLQCSSLGNPMARETWWATVHGVAKSRTTKPAQARQNNGSLFLDALVIKEKSPDKITHL